MCGAIGRRISTCKASALFGGISFKYELILCCQSNLQRLPAQEAVGLCQLFFVKHSAAVPMRWWVGRFLHAWLVVILSEWEWPLSVIAAGVRCCSRRLPPVKVTAP